MDFNKVYFYFISWLNGLIEDDPIPYEIKSLVFFVNENNEIGFSGSEDEVVNVVEHCFFFPFESEYFDYKPLYNYFYKNNFSKDMILDYLKNLLEKLKQDNYFGKFNIYFGFLQTKSKKI